MSDRRSLRRLPRLAGLLLAATFSTTALAADGWFGDWKWNVDDPDMFYAGTENSAGNMLAQFCDPAEGSCMYAVSFGITCDPGDRYPVLVNSDAGAAQMEFVCGDKLNDEHPMMATDFDAMDNLVKTANRVGFAIPMQGDEFKAVRFSLRGSNEAIDAMRTTAEHAGTRKPASRSKPVVERF